MRYLESKLIPSVLWRNIVYEEVGINSLGGLYRKNIGLRGFLVELLRKTEEIQNMSAVEQIFMFYTASEREKEDEWKDEESVSRVSYYKFTRSLRDISSVATLDTHTHIHTFDS